MKPTNGMDRGQFHDKAWTLWQEKALDSALLPKLSIHAIRTLWDVLYDSMPIDTSANVAHGAEAFPYQKTFNAIAAATSISGGHVAISVAKFVEALGAAPPAQTADAAQGADVVTDDAISSAWFATSDARNLLPHERAIEVVRKFLAAPPAQPALTDELQAEVERLNAIINTPHADDFLRAVSIEAEHQRQRWGAEGDAGKTPADWFWLVGHLAGKALHAHAASNAEKAEHHVITSAAALANWHRNMLGNTDMRPGIDGDAALTAAQSTIRDTK